MRRLPKLSVLALGLALAAPATFAQTPASANANSNPLIATVNNTQIHLNDLRSAAASLPPQMQQLPPDQLMPMLLNQVVDRQALLIAAKKIKLEKDPDVAARMQDAANVQLENAYVQKQVANQVTDTAVQAAYDRDYANKPGVEQVDARQILVPTQAQAEDIIKQLNKGADFATLAQKYSIDPGAKNGGELGWFSQDEMIPVFANAAFALKPHEYTKTPVHSQFGWHVILCEGRRTAPVPPLADVQDQIREKLANQAVQNLLDQVRSQVKITIYGADGKPLPQQAPATSPSSP